MKNKDYNPHSHSIKTWAEEDRPREKLLMKGRQVLTDAELLAIIIGAGNREESAVALSRRILKSFDNNLNELSKCSLAELQKFKGVGEAKAVSIAACLELGRRRQLVTIKSRPQVKSSKDAFDVLGPLLADLRHEEFWILILNRSNRITDKICISTGGVAGTVVDPKIIFKKAIEANASSLILFHNHPSGNLKPSQADIDITRKLKKGGEMLDIAVLDHLIISESGYFSFADEGVL